MLVLLLVCLAKACTFNLGAEPAQPLERELQTDFRSRDSRALDLDSGRVLSVPTDVPILNNARPLPKWMVNNRADLLVTSHGSNQLSLHLDDGKIAAITNGTFSALGSHDVERELAMPGVSQHLMVAPGGSKNLLVFRTREGGEGVLEVLATEDRSKVGIRYRLLQSEATKWQ